VGTRRQNGRSKRSSYTIGANAAAAGFIARRESAANRTRRKPSRPKSARDAIPFQARDGGKQPLLLSTQRISPLQLPIHALSNLPKLLMVHLQLCNLSLVLFLPLYPNFDHVLCCYHQRINAPQFQLTV